jgi:hypothetical protein
MENYNHEFAEWIQSWATRLQNAYDHNIDKDGLARFNEAIAHFERTGKFTPGQMAYFINRDSRLGQGKLQNYNTYRGLDKRMGNILPVPVKAVILGGLVDWSIQYKGLPELTKRLAKALPGWEYNARSGCWQGVSPQFVNNLHELFN